MIGQRDRIAGQQIGRGHLLSLGQDAWRQRRADFVDELAISA